MSEPFNESSWWRYVIRSKDRLSGTPNNFVVQLPNPIPDTVNECWVQVERVALSSYPHPLDTITVQAQSGSGLYNQPTLPSTIGTAVSSVTTTTGGFNNFGFDTANAIDVCLSETGVINTLDTESITAKNTYVLSSGISAQVASVTSINVPISNKNGICVSGSGYAVQTGDTATLAGVLTLGGGAMVCTGFTSTGVTFQFLPTPGTTTATWGTIASGTALVVTPAQPPKSRADKTLVLVPYGRGDYERTAKLLYPSPWTRLSASNLSTLNIKLFSDRGYPLKLRKFYYGAAGDANDINIDEWEMVLVVATLPKGSVQHKI